MNALVIGYGSIGTRHAGILNKLGCHTAVVSKREVDFSTVYRALEEALEKEGPDYVVIASATNQHREMLLSLGRLGFTGTVLVEKPLFKDKVELPPLPFHKVFVAYNLRFHPVIQRLKSLLEDEVILSVQAYVGQYLPDWRPASDYRISYSALADQGGGALRDLSHELDYLTWMLGKWERVSAIGGHFSALEITSDDVFSLLYSTASCPIASVQLNYLDRMTRRFVIINTGSRTIEADLIRGTITIDNECESFITERDDTYRLMHQAILSGAEDGLCSLDEGFETMCLIEAAEQAARDGTWVQR